MAQHEDPRPEHAAYEAPKVEQVLTPEQLAREVKYAGDPPSLTVDNLDN